MGGRTSVHEAFGSLPPPVGPSWASALLLAVTLFLLLLSNGRPISAGDTLPTEHVAASVVQEADFDLDEYSELGDPFVRTVRGHRVSIYPVLSAVLAAPIFALASLLFALDNTGTALAGKVASSVFSALAAATIFLAVGRRAREAQARLTAVLFALGTTVWATSQALWQHPASVLFLSLAVLAVLRAEEGDEAWASRLGLPLALAVAARPANVLLASALALGIAARWPRRLPGLLLYGTPPVLFLLAYQWAYFGSPLRHGFSGATDRFDTPWGVGQLGLLLSPGKGLLVFTPVTAVAGVGLVRAFLRGQRWLAGTLGLGFVAHLTLMGKWGGWDGGLCWGPRLMTDALPFLLFFLPWGLDVLPRLGIALGVFSVAVQALGAFVYDYRWDSLHQRSPGSEHLWDISKSPILFHVRERTVTLALPVINEGHARIHEHCLVLFSPDGSRVRFRGDAMVVDGVPATMSDVHAEQGAQIVEGRLRLERRWDGLFLRVLPRARAGTLELRITGRGQGPLYVGESTFWSPVPRWTRHFVQGHFRLRHRYEYATSGGADLRITVGRGFGSAEIEGVDLVSPDAPWDGG